MSGTLVDNLRLLGSAGTNTVMAGEMSRLARRASLAARLTEPKKDGLGALVYPFDPDLAALAVRYREGGGQGEGVSSRGQRRALLGHWTRMNTACGHGSRRA